MKIYLASSWRNLLQPLVLTTLREAGHEVYDFRNPAPGNTGFSWSKITPDSVPWSSEKTRDVLTHPIAEAAFTLDYNAMQWADAIVMLQPCGRSAAMELGWAAGAEKFTIVLLDDGQEPELMVKMADHICITLDEVIAVLGRLEKAMEAIVRASRTSIASPEEVAEFNKAFERAYGKK